MSPSFVMGKKIVLMELMSFFATSNAMTMNSGAIVHPIAFSAGGNVMETETAVMEVMKDLAQTCLKRSAHWESFNVQIMSFVSALSGFVILKMIVEMVVMRS